VLNASVADTGTDVYSTTLALLSRSELFIKQTKLIQGVATDRGCKGRTSGGTSLLANDMVITFCIS
jgi:hypothetical protein